MNVIATAGRKGGVGKTSTAYVLAKWFADEGKRVLAIDLDPQANLSAALDLDFHGTTTDQWLLDQAEPQSVTVNLAGTAGGTDLTSGRMNGIWPDRLAQRLQGSSWDVVICDCPPGSPPLEHLAVAAANKVAICTDDHLFGVTGAVGLLREIQNNTAISPDVAIVRAKVNARTIRSRQAEEGLGDLDVPIYSIRVDEALANVTLTGETLATTTRAGEDLRKVFEWVTQ